MRGDEWTTALAEVNGASSVQQIVNGALAVKYTDITLDDRNIDARNLAASGQGKALSSGYISLQSNGHPIEFRKIEVLPIDDAPAQSPEK